MNKKTLFQFDTKGRLKQWSVEVIDHGDHSEILVESGLVDGKITPSPTIIDEGKNIGKSNETTPYQQAVKEAESKIDKKVKEGYVTNKDEAKSPSELGSGCPKPMLAQKYDPFGVQKGSKTLEKMKILGAKGCAQRKFDGVRRLTKVTVSGCTMYTRKGLEAVPQDHIAEQLRECFVRHLPTLQKEYGIDDHIWVDCEAYTDIVPFNQFSGAMRKSKEKLTDKHKKILSHAQFRIYDVILPLGYEERKEVLPLFAHKDVIVVESFELDFNDEELQELHDNFVEHGYEGLMIRQYGIPYENKRTWQLVKMKVFEDAEFVIAGGEESVRKGELGAFILKLNEPATNPDGSPKTTCKASLKFSQPERKEFWENLDSLIGQTVTAEYFGVSEYNVPRFPKVIAFRNGGE